MTPSGRLKGKSSRRRCPYCGRTFIPTDDRDCCRDCERLARIANMKPRAWDAAFDERVAALLMQRFGEWVRLGHELGAHSWDVKLSIRLLRRRGFEIDGDQHLGHRLVGWRRWRDDPTNTARQGAE